MQFLRPVTDFYVYVDFRHVLFICTVYTLFMMIFAMNFSEFLIVFKRRFAKIFTCEVCAVFPGCVKTTVINI